MIPRTLRRGLLALIGMVALVGCGNGDEQPAEPLPTARYRIEVPTPTPAASASASASGGVPGGPSVGSATSGGFAQGLDDYCTSYYQGQVQAEDAFPRLDLMSLVQRDRAEALSARRTARALRGLSAPIRFAHTYADFVALTNEIATDRARMARSLASTGQEGPAGDDFDTATIARRELASELGASGCDGQLPRAERTAAVAALKEFETTQDSAAACGELATPGFLQTRFSDLADPLTGCIQSRQRNTAWGLPTGIKVSEVVGSDGIAASIRYSLVGGCACLGSGEAIARLHLVDGRWLVASFS